jgi:hypothetical protein
VKRTRTSTTTKNETKAPAKKRTKKDSVNEVNEVNEVKPEPTAVPVITPSQAPSGPVETQTAVAPKKKVAAKRGAKKTE